MLILFSVKNCRIHKQNIAHSYRGETKHFLRCDRETARNISIEKLVFENLSFGKYRDSKIGANTSRRRFPYSAFAISRSCRGPASSHRHSSSTAGTSSCASRRVAAVRSATKFARKFDRHGGVPEKFELKMWKSDVIVNFLWCWTLLRSFGC